MKKNFTFALLLALSISSGCKAEENSNKQSNITGKQTRSVVCYSGGAAVYQHNNVILVAGVSDTDISVRIQEVDTGIPRRIPVSQCYFKDN